MAAGPLGRLAGRDLFHGAEQEHRPADADLVARPQPADLHRRAVDAGAVGAFQVGQDDVAVLELDLGVEAADALVVEAQEVPFLAADGHRDRQVAEDPALVDPFEDLERHRLHRNPLTDARRGSPRERPLMAYSIPGGRCGPVATDFRTGLNLPAILSAQRSKVNFRIAGTRHPGRRGTRSAAAWRTAGSASALRRRSPPEIRGRRGVRAISR